MADASVIKEFLVALGFTVSEPGLKKFGTGIATATKAVVGIAAATTAAAVTLGAFVKDAAEGFEKLYFASQRAGTSAENLRALQYGFTQIGLGADAATQTLEAFALSLKLNPAQEGFLRQLGIVTRDAPNKMRDTSAIMTDFVKKLSSMPPWLAAQWAQMFGLSAQQLFQMQRYAGELAETQRRYKEEARAFGIDLDAYALKSHEFMVGIRQLGNDIDLIWKKISGTLITEFEPELEKIHQFFFDNKETIASLGVKFGEDVHDILATLVRIVEVIDELRKGTIKWQDAVLELGNYAENVLSYPFRQAWETMKKIYDMLPKMPKWLNLGVGGGANGRPSEFGNFFGDAPGRIKKFWDDFFKGAADAQLFMPLSYQQQGGGGDGIVRTSYQPGGATTTAQRPVSGSLASRGKMVMDALINQLGLSPAQAAGVASNLAAESNISAINELHPRGGRGGFGIAQWTGSRRVDFERWSAENGLDPTSMDANIKFLIHELQTKYGRVLGNVMASKTARDAAAAFFPYESGNAASLQYHLGDHSAYADDLLKNYNLGQSAGGGGRGGVNMHQKTDIHVHGNDAGEVARQVETRQRGVNADMIRNLGYTSVYA